MLLRSVPYLTPAPYSISLNRLMMANTISYDSSTNKRLRNPSHAQSLAQDAVQSWYNNPSASVHHKPEYRTIIGLGPGRSGTKSLCELLSFQTNVVHCEHEMIVPRLFPRSASGHIVAYASTPAMPMIASEQEGGKEPCEIDAHQQNKQQCQPRKKQVKGSWGADRRLEWDAPKLGRGRSSRSDEDEALWRVLRLLEQRHVFDGWVNDYYHGANNDKGKPKKLGTKGWTEYNNAMKCNGSNPQSSSDVTNKSIATRQQKQMHSTNIQHKECNMNKPKSDNTNPTHSQKYLSIPAIATVSSVELAYTHEYIALNPSVKILIVLRSIEEVVQSFMTKSRGRNHWQKHTHGNNKETVKVQRDKTWDNAFPNMSNDECHLAMSSTAIDNTPTPTTIKEEHHRPEKIWAIRAYCKLYSEVATQLAQHYPENVRVCDMHSALNDADRQFELLKWCGFDEPVVDTCLHLNKKK
mmetsp:Transcript_25643/g.38488  ORF Transcript_25643/g.38488 Transcript_25643/m.38488 type:complete len:466 (+) Transcript_25643:255-1652(+)